MNTTIVGVVTVGGVDYPVEVPVALPDVARARSTVRVGKS